MRFVLVLSVFAVIGALVVQFTRSVRPEIAAESALYAKRRAAEGATREEAPWFGETGLDDDTERELPHYLRREFGEFLDDSSGLRARDLEYVGVHRDDVGAAHFWRIRRASAGEPTFAYIEIDSVGRPVSYGWGSRSPHGETLGRPSPQ